MKKKYTNKSCCRHGIINVITWLQIFIQIIFPIITFVPAVVRANENSTSNVSDSPFSSDHLNTDKTATPLPYESTMSGVAGSLSSSGAEGIKEMAVNATTGYASDAVQKWLAGYGTARVQLNVDQNGNWDNSSFDFLAPLYDGKKALLFTQLGVRAPDGRTTSNIGMGVRTFYNPKWMYGANVFFDDDIAGGNKRIGLGAEAWTDNLKLSANVYLGTTEWHSSDDFDDYNEKPADGYDIRAEAYLPELPQLGAKLMYEQYYGDKVALFDKDHLQSNPSAVTLGLNYTPFPLITASMDYKRGQDSMDETQFGINFRYTLGQKFEDQISPAQVVNLRSLAGARYDLVERNNEIVLQYQKKKTSNVLSNMALILTKDNSPADGVTANSATITATTQDGSPARNAVISWTSTGQANLSNTSSVTDDNGHSTITITDKSAEQVVIQATSSGISRNTTTTFAKSISAMDLKITKDKSVADGKSDNSGTVLIKDANGQPMPNMPVSWQVSNKAFIGENDSLTNEKGEANVNFSSSIAGSVTVTASSSGKSASANSSFVSQAATSIDVTAKVNNAPADGKAADTFQAIVEDGNGQPVPSAVVNWSISGSTTAKMTSPSSVQTNAQGIAMVTVADSAAEQVTITATSSGLSDTDTASFSIVSVNNLAVSMTTNNSPADNLTTNKAQARITDANGQPVKGIPVTWSLSGSTTANLTSDPSGNTDDNGIVTVSLKDSVAESVTLTASGAGLSSPVTAVFTPVSVSNIVVSMVTNNSPADNATINEAQAVVTDSNGQPLQGVTVTWSLSGSTTAILTTATTATTDNSGIAKVSLKDSVSEPVTVTATSGTKTSSTTATFTTVVAKNIVVKITKDNSVANNTDLNTAQATVTDSGGKPIANMAVNWSLSGISSAEIASEAISYTDQEGKTSVSVKDAVAESVTVMANADQIENSAVMNFTSVPVGTLVVTVERNNAFADGVDTNQTKVIVRDSSGQPISGESVTWSLSGSTTAHASSPLDVSTNSQGEALLSVTDLVAESNVVITATANGKSAQATISFIPQIAAVTVTVQTNNAAADNASENILQATLTDAKGQVVPNASVTWSIASGSSATATSPLTVTTDGNGIAILKLVDSAVETVTATAHAEAKEDTGSVVFTAAAVGTVNVSMLTNNVSGNGTAVDVAQAVVLDANNQPIKNVPVTWVITGSTTAEAVSSLTISTDDNGKANLSLTDTVGEGVTVTANVGGKSGQTTATFVSAAFGPVTVDTEHTKTGNPSINVSLVQNGLDVTVYSYPGMAAGDQLTVNFKVTGQAASTSTIPMTDHTFPVHTVTSQEVGKSVIFTVPSGEVLGLQPETSGSLEGTATATAVNPTTLQQSTGTVSYNLDTLQ
ncbi:MULTISPECIES: Ig-like domain-containing protein [Enterobacterales]|uniref:Ig-like domain-containing protein n=1 Tax=Enterobacterales TaxID=91347 RepID=UPI002ED8A6B9